MRQTFLGQMVQTTTCPTCNGRGETIASPCKTCHGSGLERKTIKKKVQIPAGVDGGTQIRLAGEGGPGANGGPNGSLFLILDVASHQFFKRRENDILLNLDINIAQATLGAERRANGMLNPRGVQRIRQQVRIPQVRVDGGYRHSRMDCDQIDPDQGDAHPSIDDDALVQDPVEDVDEAGS